MHSHNPVFSLRTLHNRGAHIPGTRLLADLSLCSSTSYFCVPSVSPASCDHSGTCNFKVATRFASSSVFPPYRGEEV